MNINTVIWITGQLVAACIGYEMGKTYSFAAGMGSFWLLAVLADIRKAVSE